MYDFLVESVSFPMFFAAFCVCYVSYYLIFVGRKPELIYGDSCMRRLLQTNIDVVNKVYWPTFWCFSAHPMTIFSTILRKKSNVPYQRELLDTPDGGSLVIDWVKNDENNQIYPNPDLRPTVVIVPGLTGCSDESYCRQMVESAMAMGLRALIMTSRGSGKNWQLKTPRTFSGNYTDDLRLVMKHLESLYPKSPVIGVGVSFGGSIMTHYIAEVGQHKQMIGAFLVSVQWNCYKSLDSLDKPLNWILYNRHLVKSLKRIIQRNLHIYEQHINNLPIELENVFKSKTLREFSESFTIKLFGYDNLTDYYDDAKLDSENMLKGINIPTLFLCAEDDPFAPGITIPRKLVSATSHVAVIATKYGGHIGFLEGLHPRTDSLVDKTLRQFAKCLLK